MTSFFLVRYFLVCFGRCMKKNLASEQLKPILTPALCHTMAVYLYKIGNTMYGLRKREIEWLGFGWDFGFVRAFHECISFSFALFRIVRPKIPNISRIKWKWTASNEWHPRREWDTKKTYTQLFKLQLKRSTDKYDLSRFGKLFTREK